MVNRVGNGRAVENHHHDAVRPNATQMFFSLDRPSQGTYQYGSTITAPPPTTTSSTSATTTQSPFLSQRSLSSSSTPAEGASATTSRQIQALSSEKAGFEEAPGLKRVGSFTSSGSSISSLESQSTPERRFAAKQKSFKKSPNNKKKKTTFAHRTQKDQFSNVVGFWSLHEPENTQSSVIGQSNSCHRKFKVDPANNTESFYNIEVVQEEEEEGESEQEEGSHLEAIGEEEEDDSNLEIFKDEGEEENHSSSRAFRIPDDGGVLHDTKIESYEKLIDTVQKLCARLEASTSRLAKEEKRRRSRELNILSLAKKLKKKDSTISNQEATMEQLREQLTMEQQELEREKLESRKQHDNIRKDYESRLNEIKKSHSQQCNDLCQEVIEANHEIDRLRKELADQATRNKGLSLREVFETAVFLGYALFKSTRPGIMTGQNGHSHPSLLQVKHAPETIVFTPSDSGSETGFFSVKSQNDVNEIASLLSSEENEDLCDKDVDEVLGESDAEIEAESNFRASLPCLEEQEELALTVYEKRAAKSNRGISWVRRRIAKLRSKIKRRANRKKNQRKDKEAKRDSSLLIPTRSSVGYAV